MDHLGWGTCHPVDLCCPPRHQPDSKTIPWPFVAAFLALVADGNENVPQSGHVLGNGVGVEVMDGWWNLGNFFQKKIPEWFWGACWKDFLTKPSLEWGFGRYNLLRIQVGDALILKWATESATKTYGTVTWIFAPFTLQHWQLHFTYIYMRLWCWKTL